MATVAIAVTSVNDAPVANGQSVITNEDTTAAVVLSATDIDSQSLNFRIVTNPSKGTLSPISAPNCVVNAGGANCAATVIYTPNSRPKRFGWFYFCR
jgi:hypothetical protein